MPGYSGSFDGRPIRRNGSLVYTVPLSSSAARLLKLIGTVVKLKPKFFQSFFPQYLDKED